MNNSKSELKRFPDTSVELISAIFLFTRGSKRTAASVGEMQCLKFFICI